MQFYHHYCIQSLHNRGTDWVATVSAFTRKSTLFLFHALRDVTEENTGKSFRPLNKLKLTEDFPPQAMLFELTTE
jgi:hypothetical protein